MQPKKKHSQGKTTRYHSTSIAVSYDWITFQLVPSILAINLLFCNQSTSGRKHTGTIKCLLSLLPGKTEKKITLILAILNANFIHC